MLSVIVPAHRAGPELERCLSALHGAEVWVVASGPAPGVAEAARRHGFRVLHQPAKGPAAARNLGAEAASGDILVFLDSDVEVTPTTLQKLEQAMEQADAVFGSYDDAPVHRNVCSLYANLRHHYVHQTSPRETGTFWTGCGAIRRQVFRDFGGFCTDYEEPSIEDIDLGMRLHAAGRRILLCPDIQVTHCKSWSLPSLLTVDIFRRAVPWTRRLLQLKRVPAVLNLGWTSRLSAFAAWLAVAGLLIEPWLALIALGAVVGLNAELMALFLKKGGALKGLGCCALHVLYYLYSSATFAAVMISCWGRAGPGGAPRRESCPSGSLRP